MIDRRFKQENYQMNIQRNEWQDDIKTHFYPINEHKIFYNKAILQCEKWYDVRSDAVIEAFESQIDTSINRFFK